MTADDTTVVARPHSAEELDEVFDALAHRYRRAIIQRLEWGEPATLDDLVTLITDRDDSAAASDVRTALVHNHLPRLAETDVITYDAETHVTELDDAVAERAILAAVHGSE
ncbi:helix-turn-helix domain-containing protein [Halobacteria archaeon HArc-gm2]|nr:helix-turn-helix domain-containing protein [Halobacteria archaeon HArc-gm2]